MNRICQLRGLWALALLLSAGVGSMGLLADDAKGAGPWRLGEAAHLPKWLAISGTQRTRYETLDGQFRVGRSGGDQMLAFRTTVKLEASAEASSVVGEIVDSRQLLADSGTPATVLASSVDALEWLQAYGAVRFSGPFSQEARSEIRFGRQTLEMGSRRLVARNRFRNTINTFTGLHYQWQPEEDSVVRAFYVLPVRRRPIDPRALLDSKVQIDDEGFDLQFWGVHAQRSDWFWGATGEAYVFGLHERDSAEWATRNRQIYTPGLRLSRRPAQQTWDFDFESILQVGSLRNSTAATDSRDLRHWAYFGHAEVGYTLGESWSPRAALIYDYASGDHRATDDASNRFDTLFGARRFEHGPTGIYGAFARSNIQSPGLRLSARPWASLDVRAAYRPYWLASASDAWTTSGLRDPRGRSGSLVGHQWEASVRWEVWPGNAQIELGGAYLLAGEFIEKAPNASGQGDSVYGYLAWDLTF